MGNVFKGVDITPPVFNDPDNAASENYDRLACAANATEIARSNPDNLPSPQDAGCRSPPPQPDSVVREPKTYDPKLQQIPIQPSQYLQSKFQFKT